MKNSNKIYLSLFVLLVVAFSVGAQGFMITESLRDDNAGNFTFGGQPTAFLTSGVEDPEGQGWLRLTKDSTFQKGYAVVTKPFPSSIGVLIDLEFKIWRTDPKNQGADGFSIFLFNAATKTFKIGGFGGSLGYAQFDNVGAEASDGLSGGYVGLGLDEFGNYSKFDEGRIGGEGFHGNSIGVRGPLPEYRWLGGNFKLVDTLQYVNADIKLRPSDSTYYRRIQIEIVPNTNPDSSKFSIRAKIKWKKGSKFQSVLKSFQLDSIPPAMLQLGFGASTGACINYHELRNLFITTPGGVRVTKQVDKLNATVGDELTYTIDLYNQTDRYVQGLLFKDNLAEFSSKFKVSSITFDDNGYPKNVATGYTNTELSNATVAMEANSQATFIVKGRIKGCPPNKLLVNKAIFNDGDGEALIFDLDAANDTAIVKTKIADLGLIAVDDRASTGPEMPVLVPVLDNDLESVSPIVPSSVEIMSGPSNGISSANTDGTILYTPNENFSGIDTLTYKMADESGKQSNIANVFIKVSSKEIFIPNVFTPTGDGINDYFEIVGLSYYPKPKLRITNRWGDEVYYNSDYQNNWDGHGLNEGTYYFCLILNDKGKDVVHKGWVLLKR